MTLIIAAKSEGNVVIGSDLLELSPSWGFVRPGVYRKASYILKCIQVGDVPLVIASAGESKDIIGDKAMKLEYRVARAISQKDGRKKILRILPVEEEECMLACFAGDGGPAIYLSDDAARFQERMNYSFVGYVPDLARSFFVKRYRQNLTLDRATSLVGDTLGVAEDYSIEHSHATVESGRISYSAQPECPLLSGRFVGVLSADGLFLRQMMMKDPEVIRGGRFSLRIQQMMDEGTIPDFKISTKTARELFADA